MPGIRRGLLLILLLASLAVVLSGCGEYRQFASWYADIFPRHFTFEYPRSFYEVDTTYGFPESNITGVRFFRQGTEELKLLPVVSSISVIVEKPASWLDTDARDAIENELSDYENDENFKILERKSISVAGLSAEYVSFSISRLFRNSSSPTHNRLVRFVAFDSKGSLLKQGLVWKIELVCFEEEIQETQAYFDHLLDTFRILD